MRLFRMESLLPFMGMVVVILAQVTNMLLSKIAFSKGLNKDVLVVYSSALSCLVLLPCSLIFHRSERPPLTISIVGRFLLLALFVFLMQIFGFAGIQYSSPILATSMLNTVPALTFILAIFFRMENFDWRSSSSLAKSLGTIASIIGAFIVTLYKGPSPVKLSISHGQQLLPSPKSTWILGGLFLAADAILGSAWYILQSSTAKKFPAQFTISFYQFFFCTIMSSLYSLVVVKDTTAWQLRLDVQLVAVLYSAMSSAIRISLTTWCLSKAGPHHVAMFQPLGFILAVIMDAMFIGEVFGLGSLIGAAVIFVGFYAIMWGKAKEEFNDDKGEGRFRSSSTKKEPLLQIEDEGTS